MIMSDTITPSVQEAPEVQEPQAPVSPIQALITEQFTKYVADITRLTPGNPPMVEAQDVRLFSTHAEVVVNNLKKNISLEAFKEVLDGMMQESDSTIPAFQLPYGCYSFAVSGTSMQIGCYYPSSKRTIIYKPGDREYKYEVVMPNVVIAHFLTKDKNQWVVDRTKYFCTSKNVTQLPEALITQANRSESLFLIPISNMYETGEMCFGNNTMPRRMTQNLRGLDYYYQILFDAPYNNDLGVKALRLGSPVDWFPQWAECTEFPYQRLINRE